MVPCDLHWDTLQATMFPHCKTPQVDEKSPVFQVYFARYLQQLVAQKPVEQREAKNPEDRQAVIDECSPVARDLALLACKSDNAHNAEFSSRRAFAESCAETIRTAVEDAKRQGTDVGLARVLAQKQCIEKLKVFEQMDNLLPDSYIAIRNWIYEQLQNNPNTRNFGIKPRAREPAFSNLTKFGAFVVRELLQQEGIRENYAAHRQALQLITACLGVYLPSPMQCNVLIHGPAKVSKSFLLMLIDKFIAGTHEALLGQSDKAEMTKGVKDTDRKIQFMEEVPPSYLGIEGQGSVKGGQAMTDKASAIRALQTNTKIGYKRLVKDPETGAYRREIVSEERQTMVALACNIIDDEMMPENMKSRYLVLSMLPTMRRADYSLATRVNDGIPEKYKSTKKQLDYELRVRQAQIWRYGFAVEMNIVELPGIEACNLFIDEVVALALQCGVSGVMDVRHLDRIKGQVRIRCMEHFLDEYYNFVDSPAKNQPFEWEHIIEWEKHFEAKIDTAVFVLTLCSEQFLSPIASSFAHAFNMAFNDSPYHDEAVARVNKREGFVDDAQQQQQQQSRSPQQHEEMDTSPDGKTERKGGEDGLMINEESKAAWTPPNIQDPDDYFVFSLADKNWPQLGIGKVGPQPTVTQDHLRIQRLYNYIAHHLISAPNPKASVAYLQSLLTAQVPNAAGTSTITALQIDEFGNGKVIFSFCSWFFFSFSFFSVLDCPVLAEASR